MGFDVYGKNPVIVKGTKEPEWPENYGELSDEEQSDYWNKKDEFQSKNPGTYFRASVWSWRPILDIITKECSDLLDEKTLEGLAYNDGCGPDDQDTCTKMAERIELFVKSFQRATKTEGFELPSDMRVKDNGTLVSGDDKDWTGTRSAYSADWDHIMEFCTFLRSCGGFKAC